MCARVLKAGGILAAAVLALGSGGAQGAPPCHDAAGKTIAVPSDLYGTKWLMRSGDPVAQFKDAGGVLKLDWPIKVPDNVKPDADAKALLENVRLMDVSFINSVIKFTRTTVIFSDKGSARESHKIWYDLEIGSDCQTLFGTGKMNNDRDLAESARFTRQH